MNFVTDYGDIEETKKNIMIIRKVYCDHCAKVDVNADDGNHNSCEIEPDCREIKAPGTDIYVYKLKYSDASYLCDNCRNELRKMLDSFFTVGYMELKRENII